MGSKERRVADRGPAHTGRGRCRRAVGGRGGERGEGRGRIGEEKDSRLTPPQLARRQRYGRRYNTGSLGEKPVELGFDLANVRIASHNLGPMQIGEREPRVLGRVVDEPPLAPTPWCGRRGGCGILGCRRVLATSVPQAAAGAPPPGQLGASAALRAGERLFEQAVMGAPFARRGGAARTAQCSMVWAEGQGFCLRRPYKDARGLDGEYPIRPCLPDRLAVGEHGGALYKRGPSVKSGALPDGNDMRIDLGALCSAEVKAKGDRWEGTDQGESPQAVRDVRCRPEHGNGLFVPELGNHRPDCGFEGM